MQDNKDNSILSILSFLKQKVRPFQVNLRYAPLFTWTQGLRTPNDSLSQIFGIWFWAVENLGSNHHVSIVRADFDL